MDHETIVRIIQEAKLGPERKAAQIDTCTVFSAALYDVLTSAGIACEVWDASYFVEPFSTPEWVHSVVKVGSAFYDSLGAFDHEIVRARTKVHHKVKTRLGMKADIRDFDADDFSEMHRFYVKKLAASLARIAA